MYKIGLIICGIGITTLFFVFITYFNLLKVFLAQNQV